MSLSTGKHAPFTPRPALRHAIAALAVIALAFTAAPAADAGDAAGSLDPSFGDAGTVITDFGLGPTHGEFLNDLAIQTDGKIVGAGTFLIGADGVFGLVRYNSDGTLDPSFGSVGRVTTVFPADGIVNSGARAVALQPDGRIVAAGITASADQRFALARYNPDGTLDQSFGIGGMVTSDFSDGHRGISGVVNMAIQPDGKILVVGHGQIVARYNSTGGLDQSFGIAGRVDLASQLRGISSVALQADGNIVVAAQPPLATGTNHMTLMRLRSDGNTDQNFGGTGITTIPFSRPLVARAVAAAADGSLTVGGITSTASDNVVFGVARVTSDGRLDSTFGIGGKAIADFSDGPGRDEFVDLAVQPNGQIIALGTTTVAPYESDFALARFSHDGTLDSGFGIAGKVTTSFLEVSTASALAIHADGRIVAGSFTSTVPGDGGADIALARYLAGLPDTTPPTIQTPGAITVDATSSAGAMVTYSVSASDNTDPAPQVTCTPVSGTTFAVGTTTVQCTATDSAANSSSAGFDVTVHGAEAQAGRLRDLLARSSLPSGTAKSLDVKLEHVIADMERWRRRRGLQRPASPHQPGARSERNEDASRACQPGDRRRDTHQRGHRVLTEPNGPGSIESSCGNRGKAQPTWAPAMLGRRRLREQPAHPPRRGPLEPRVSRLCQDDQDRQRILEAHLGQLSGRGLNELQVAGRQCALKSAVG